MENLFLAKGTDFEEGMWFEITGQEAQHISRVLRKKAGDYIFVSNGEGIRAHCEIVEIQKSSVVVKILSQQGRGVPKKKKVLAIGAIKKKDRLEFAIEKAVELGATEICVFEADRSERSRSNEQRLQLVIESAFKQSARFWLPGLVMKSSLDDVYMHYPEAEKFMAHEETELTSRTKELNAPVNLLLVGPEGGFSPREVELHQSIKGKMVSLGANRLRAETAVAAILSQFLFSD